MSPDVEPYRAHTAFTDPGRWTSAFAAIPPEPKAIVRVLSGLQLHPFIAPMRGVPIPAAAQDDREVRSVEGMLDRMMARDGRPLATPRAAGDRFFCVCSSDAHLATAAFRTHGIPARCRVGFAAYFNPGRLEDHWVCEYWTGDEWRLLDSQLDEQTVRDLAIDFAPWDVPRDRFLDASTVWCGIRAGTIDPSIAGLTPLGLAGAWFVAGDVMHDAAVLNRDERLLPWESWSMGLELPPNVDVPAPKAEQLDAVAGALRGSPGATVAARVYRDHAWLRPTPAVVSFATGAPVEVTLPAP